MVLLALLVDSATTTVAVGRVDVVHRSVETRVVDFRAGR